MLDSILQFLGILPVGLLVATACLEGFILARRDSDSEPAVLWLLFCAGLSGAVSALVCYVLFFAGMDPAGLIRGTHAGLIAAAASVAWCFKRVARNRDLLLVGERFYDPVDAKLPPRRKPWQAFLLIGYRLVLALSVAGAAAASHYSSAGPVESAAVVKPPVGALEAAATPPPATPENTLPVSALPGPLVPTEAPLSIDPTKSFIPSEDASSLAAMATSAVIAATGAPAGPTSMPAGAEASPGPVVPVIAMAPPPPARPVSKNSLYFSKVRPILAKHCLSCHGATKQKGDLRMDSPDYIRAGVNGKPIIIPGVPAKSRIYHVTGLPQDDTDRMPPKGTPLNSSERAIIAEWIKNGADLGDGVSIPSGHDGVFFVDALAANLSAPNPELIEDLKKEHILVRPLSKNGYVLELDFSHSDRAAGDLKLSQLGPIALNLYSLDFSRTAIRDADLAQLGSMKNLSRLLLSRTGITDAGLAPLVENPGIEHLNLYSTMVSDAGLATLAKLKSLKKIYLWQSKATPEGVKQLQEKVPGLIVNFGQ